MARRKKQEIESFVVSHEDTVKAFTNHCFKNGVGVCISPRFEEVYEINGVSYTFTERVLADIANTGRVVVTFQNDKEVNLRGLNDS